MKYKVHWIIDGIMEIEASSKEDAENILQKDLEDYVKNGMPANNNNNDCLVVKVR